MNAIAARLRKSAEAMEGEIQHRLNPPDANKPPTPKRLRTIEGMMNQGRSLQKEQAVLRRLADLHESGVCPAEIAHVRSRAEIERLRYGKGPAAEALKTLIESLDHLPSRRADEMKLLEREVMLRNIPGFFPTPRPVIERMLALADIQDGHSILEPSAGRGDICDAVRERFDYSVRITSVERNHSLREILEHKGHGLCGYDFLELRPAFERWDRILMNPPFERGAEIDHVMHAYTLLAAGGLLVSVMSEGPFGRSDRKSEQFRAWLESVGAETERLPDGSFKASGTGVSCRLVKIRSAIPAATAAPVESLSDELAACAAESDAVQQRFTARVLALEFATPLPAGRQRDAGQLFGGPGQGRLF
jgi:hypothetical protein